VNVYAVLAGLFLAEGLAVYFWGRARGRFLERERVSEPARMLRRQKMRRGEILGAICLVMLLTYCATPKPTATPPKHCQTFKEWAKKVPVARARVAASGGSSDERERLDREDYLESVCKGINAYRHSLIGKY
jgi:hypothetical protein